ncbi:MAG: NAD(P)-binding domain-containing protein [Pseudomonadales bacterium]|nr:NAD(P)-binding domain-containing protein [Pseudomonadales bacterium]MCP5185565.1 NAD(P)-binding domain-containing protein [Pseudomonadales bacterium]
MLAALNEAREAGLTQPPSLHPVVDPLRCIGCSSCIHACPEFPAHQILGLIDRKATLISPTDCIGHGACEKACPVGAIKLVFGTAERGVDIPRVNADYSTNVPGVFIAGELGGMGLIRNAVSQGRQAIDGVRAWLKTASRAPAEVDVFIVGAGPAGLAATLGATAAKLRYRTIEQNSLGGTVANFPRGKLVMTEPAELPVVGAFRFSEVRKETLIAFWEDVRSRTGIEIHTGERFLGVTADADGILNVSTTRGNFRSRALILAIGRRGTPRRLDVPGEELDKVSYTLIDPAEHAGRRVLVIGAGDSALEAACACAEAGAATVTLVVRGDNLARARRRNQEHVGRLVDERRLSVLYNAHITAIGKDKVAITIGGARSALDNDVVIICVGGILPTPLLESIGVDVQTKYGTA